MKQQTINYIQFKQVILLTRFLVFMLLVMLNVDSAAAVLDKSKQWQKGITLKVLFLDGDPALFRQIERLAPLWVKDTSLSFQFFRDPASAPKDTHIRISFKKHSGSRLGDHGDYQSRLPTMNLYDLITDQISDGAAKRLILHEFGHALGFEHEYRSSYWPYGNQAIEKTIAECYPKMQLIGYNQQSAISHCREINSTVTDKTAFLTAYDERSIMNYPMQFMTSDGSHKTITPAIKLSFLDRYAIQLWYAK